MKKLYPLSAALLVGLFTWASPAIPHADAAGLSMRPAYGTSPYAHRVTYAARVVSAADPVTAIRQAGARWGVDPNWLLRVATCESGLNPSAYNPGGPSGLFQMLPGTYWAYAGRIGESRSYWDASASANVAAYMFSIGHSYEWGCR